MQGQTSTWQQEPEGLHRCTGLPIWATPLLQMSCEHATACFPETYAAEGCTLLNSLSAHASPRYGTPCAKI